MLRKISLGFLILSSVAFCAAIGFMIEYQVTYREIRFVPVDIPITLQAASHHQFEFTVDEPAEYEISLGITENAEWQLFSLENLYDSLSSSFRSTSITATISSEKDSQHVSRAGGVSHSSNPTGKSPRNWYEVSTEFARVDTGVVYSCVVVIDSVPQIAIGKPAWLQVQMLRATRKAIYVENDIRYKMRQLGLIVGGLMLVTAFGFWWLLKRRGRQRSR